MKNALALVLSGGKGKRLGVLTEHRAKPAVPFGGKYRLIDFALSNCVNSEIFYIGVLTQYLPMSLEEHIGIGEPWGLNRRNADIKILHPFTGNEESDWYHGIADAIFQNKNFIEHHGSEYVLLLPGDHVYKMDYQKLLEFHRENGSQCTISYKKLPKNEAKGFGVMELKGDRVKRFWEKPEHPQTGNVSMGVYMFETDFLLKGIRKIAGQKDENAFAKWVESIGRGGNVSAFEFDGYWKDVGTLESFYNAHMDVLEGKFELKDEHWPLQTRWSDETPSFIAQEARVENSMIAGGCSVKGSVENSFLFSGVKIAPHAKVSNSIVMGESTVGLNARVEYAILDKAVHVHNNAKVCGTKQHIRLVAKKGQVR